jgi:hypothetical protein
MIDYASFAQMLKKNGFIKVEDKSDFVAEKITFKSKKETVFVSYKLGGYIQEIKFNSISYTDVEEIYNKINNN